MISIGAVSLGWSGTPLRDVFEQIAEMGGSCVEINGNADRHHGLALTSENIPQIRRWAQQTGLTIGSVSGYCDFAQTDEDALKAEIERLMTSCRAASEMEAPIVRAFTGDVKPGIDFRMVRPHIVAAFGKATEQSAELGVTLGIENHGRLVNDGPALAALVEEVGADNLGMTLDTGNFAWSGHGPDQVRVDIEAVLPHVVNVHVKDGVWTEEGFDFVPAGEGDLPLDWLMAALVERDYAGVVYSEFEGGGDFVTGTRQSIAYLRKALAEAQA
ncbi:MAG: sugar phosphate isomerase/epimerase family protein [Anaerolineae bacterium]